MATIQELMHYPNEVMNLYEVGRHGFKSLTMEYALSMIVKTVNALLYEVNPDTGRPEHSMLDKFISMVAGVKDTMEDRSEKDFIFTLGEEIFICHIDISNVQIQSECVFLFLFFYKQ